MKKIRISFPDEKVEALAVLLEDKAPSTCGCLWKALETPVEGLCIHAMWTGREISFPFPGTAFPGDKGSPFRRKTRSPSPCPGTSSGTPTHPTSGRATRTSSTTSACSTAGTAGCSFPWGGSPAPFSPGSGKILTPSRRSAPAARAKAGKSSGSNGHNRNGTGAAGEILPPPDPLQSVRIGKNSAMIALSAVIPSKRDVFGTT